jgi:hypothetical protein
MRSGRCGLAKSNASEHSFEHGIERLVGVVLVGPGPGKQRGTTNVDDGKPDDPLRLDSVTALVLLCVGFGATEGTVEEPLGVARVDGRGGGHQRRWVPINSYHHGKQMV